MPLHSDSAEHVSTNKTDSQSTSLENPKPNLFSETEDLGLGFIHGALENPYNGLTQVVDHATGAHLPEVHLIDQSHLDSAGGRIGNLLGGAADLLALSAATGGLGAVGSAAVGAGYMALAVPTDDNSKHFLQDRLANGAIGLVTMGAMKYAQGAIDAAGIFAVPAARSLTGYAADSGMVSAAGGVALAESDAVLKKGRILPTLGDLTTDVSTMVLAGMAAGGVQYGVNQISALPPVHIETDSANPNTPASVDVTLDGDGNPAKIDLTSPGRNDPYVTVHGTLTRMTNGTWSDKYTSSTGDDVYPMDTQSATMTKDGSLVINSKDIDDHDIVRTFGSNGKYSRVDTTQDAEDAADKARMEATYGKTVTTGDTARHYNTQGQMESIRNDSETETGSVIYNKDGSVQWAGLSSQKGPDVTYYEAPNHSNHLVVGDREYSWDGTIKVVPASQAHGTEQIQFIAKDGSSADFNLKSGTDQVAALAERTGTYLPGSRGPIIATTNGDKVQVTSSTSGTWSVNGKVLSKGESASVGPGDKVGIYGDFGESYPQIETRQLPWGKTASGQLTLGGEPIKDGSNDFNSTRAMKYTRQLANN